MGILFLTCVFLHGNDEKRGDLNQILMYGISYWLLLQRKCILSINEASRHGLAAYPGGRRQGRAVSCKDAPTVSCQRVSLVSRRTSTNRPRRASGDAPRGGRFLQNESGCHGSSCSMQRMEDDMMKWRKLISWNRKTGTGNESNESSGDPRWIWRAFHKVHPYLPGGVFASLPFSRAETRPGEPPPGLGSKGACNTP